MAFTIKQFPQRDEGTGEAEQQPAEVVYNADDVTGEPTGEAVQFDAETTYKADDVSGESMGDVEHSGPSTIVADWPAPAGEDKAVTVSKTDAEAKAKVDLKPKAGK